MRVGCKDGQTRASWHLSGRLPSWQARGIWFPHFFWSDFSVTASAQLPVVGIVMGSRSDWATLERAAQILAQFGVPHECEIVSAHRTPDKLTSYAKAAAGRGLKVIIAGAGGAAHLPGMMAAQTHLPVLGVPVESSMLRGVDSLLSIVQMPAGIPVGTLAIGPAGAANAALLAIAILATADAALAEKLLAYRSAQTERVLADTLGEPTQAASNVAQGKPSEK
jgi:5-(carboxyamino)imidazole ribonucleotide mutase